MQQFDGPTIPETGRGNENADIPAKPPSGASAVEAAALQAEEAYWDEAARRYRMPRPVRSDPSSGWDRFTQLAVLCIARGWDIVDYVRSVLGRPHSRIVLPDDIMSGANMAWYTAKKSVKTECDAEAEYRRCVELVIQQELEGIDEKPLLLAPSTGLPAWFRVVYPEKPDIEIIDLWGDAAKAEFDAANSRVELVEKLFPDKWARIKKMLWFYGKEGNNGL